MNTNHLPQFKTLPSSPVLRAVDNPPSLRKDG